jgi:hypothetical protein
MESSYFYGREALHGEYVLKFVEEGFVIFSYLNSGDMEEILDVYIELFL